MCIQTQANQQKQRSPTGKWKCHSLSPIGQTLFPYLTFKDLGREDPISTYSVKRV